MRGEEEEGSKLEVRQVAGFASSSFHFVHPRAYQFICLVSCGGRGGLRALRRPDREREREEGREGGLIDAKLPTKLILRICRFLVDTETDVGIKLASVCRRWKRRSSSTIRGLGNDFDSSETKDDIGLEFQPRSKPSWNDPGGA